MGELHENLARIQRELKVPKSQRNQFGNYNYRSCEDILEAVKPLLGKCTLVLTDDIDHVAGRFYVRAVAKLILENEEVVVFGYAREEETKKGMDGSQITGAASSYARKYALNGLFLIDDTKDADATNDHKEPPKPVSAMPEAPKTNDQPQGKGKPATQSAKVKKALQWTEDHGMTANEIATALCKEIADITEADLPELKVAYGQWKASKEAPDPTVAPCPDGSTDFPASYCGAECPRDLECEKKG